jgi:hypothetical protein
LGERLCEGENVTKPIAALGDRKVEGPLTGRHAAHAAQACVGTSIWHAAVTGADAAAMATGWARQLAEGEGVSRAYEQGKRTEELAQALLLRDIVPDPFRPVSLEQRWLTSTVVALAGGIYDEKAFDRLPILADGLQDAGCEDESVLGHCRGDGPHVRGCWVVDQVLGRG